MSLICAFLLIIIVFNHKNDFILKVALQIPAIFTNSIMPALISNMVESVVPFILMIITKIKFIV